MTTATQAQSRTQQLRWSESVIVKTAIFLPKTREIKTMDANGIVRICKIDRLDLHHARSMWKFIQEAVECAWPVAFAANSGYSPDRWFCDCCTDMNDLK